MKRSWINLLLDAVLLLCLMLIAGLGLLMEYVLIPGRERSVVYGRDVDLYCLGLDRHQWGDIHLAVGFAFLALLVVHVWLHWRQIVSVYKRHVGARPTRWAFGLGFGALCVVLLLGPLVAPIDVRAGLGHGRRQAAHRHQEAEASAGHEYRHQQARASAGHERRHQHARASAGHEHSAVASEVNGQWTLGDVSRSYDVPLPSLIATLGLPDSTSADARIGRLRRRHGFRMQDVRAAVASASHAD